MAANHEIVCVNKSDASNVAGRIINIGYIEPGGSLLKISQPQAIERIESRKLNLWVKIDGKPVWVNVGRTPAGDHYLMAGKDNEHHALLCIPGCS